MFTLQAFPANNEGEYLQLANTSCFSLHKRVFANACEPDKLERPYRCISRPTISKQRLSMTSHGKVRYELKMPYQDGKTHVFFKPIDFIGSSNSHFTAKTQPHTIFLGFFLNSNLRAQLTGSQSGNNNPLKKPVETKGSK
ncbi:MAG: hypothetical protein ACI96N_002931 [Arenicella sp.]